MVGINPFWLVIASLVLALIPLILGVVTSYLKVSIVLGMFKSGLGAQQVPGQIVIAALSFGLTIFIMAPVFARVSANYDSEAFAGMVSGKQKVDLNRAYELLEPFREFLFQHSDKRELASVRSLLAKQKLKSKSSENRDEAEQIQEGIDGFTTLLPAFVLTELKEAFAMGFVILLPFLVVDLIVANLLVGMGMVMVSPVMIALPLKLILFILVDGWLLLTNSLVTSYL